MKSRPAIKLPPHLQIIVDKINKQKEENLKNGFTVYEITSDQIFARKTGEKIWK